MKTILSLCAVFFISVIGFSQNGLTPATAFTQLGQAQTAAGSGTYYFKLGANPVISTQVQQPGGWILVAAGSGNTGTTPLATTTTLSFLSDAILPTYIYTDPSTNAVRFNATTGVNLPFDVQITNASANGAIVLSNLHTDQTLSANIALSTGDWTGAGSVHMDFGGGSSNRNLNEFLYHSSGNATGFNWRMPNEIRVVDNQGSNNALNLWISAPFATLPIELISFTTSVETDKAKISWSTATEINNDYFTIEKSLDGIHWDILTKVAGSGNSSVRKDYYFYDKSLVNGKQFYRLKQTDLDKKSKYSEVRFVSFSKQGRMIAIYPNPVTDYFNLRVEGQSFSNSTVKIFDLNGNKLYQSALTTNSLTIDTQKLPAGLYVLEVNLQGLKQELKMIKK